MAAGVYSVAAVMRNVTSSPYVDVTATPETSEELRLTRIVVKLILIPIVVAFGVLGNIINIVVLTRKWMRSSTNYYLTALAIYDILYLVFVVTVLLTSSNPIVVEFANIASNTGVWLTLTFTIERYIGVCHPMRGHVLCTPKRAKYVIAGVCIAGAIVTFPGFFKPWIGTWLSYDIGYNNVNQAVFTYLPLALLLVFNTLLVRSVMRASRERAAMMQGMTTSSRRARRAAEQSRVTTMLIIVVVVFLVCQLPSAIMNTVDPPKTDNIIIIHNVCNLLVVINSAVNFVLYSSVSGKFRRTFRHVFLRCASRNEPTRQNLFSEAGTHASPQATTHLVMPSPAVSRRCSRASQNGYDPVATKLPGTPASNAATQNTAKSLVKNDFLQVNPDLRR
ncbi:FMRFamide receptor [Lamellibrachia satsuma]|nr:FMRFamide receptor [Lamellibrachia satsuma]